MYDFSDADISVFAARSVLISNGEHEAAEELRGLEVFGREDAKLALTILNGLKPRSEVSQLACAAARDALAGALEADYRPRPSVAA